MLNQTGHASNNAWSTLGPLYGGAAGLKAMFADGRLALRQLSSAGVESAWSFPPLAGSPAPIEVTDAGTWSNTLGLVAAGADFAQPGGTSGDLVVARPTGEAQARLVYAVNTSGSWLASAPAAFSLGAGNLDLRQVRVAAGHHSAMVVAQVFDLSVGSATKLITAVLDHGTGQVIATPMLPAATFGGTGFDAVALGPSVYLAAADGMALTLWHAPLDGSGGWSTDPANNITAAGTCFLENPELVAAGAELWVTWVQRCGVNSQVLAAAYR
ncbi:MAG: hypothetical protein IPJ65_06555 [Archangiaceae bacterium]|nr:hypothetical protein [Archangiaceae bacterium]